MAAGVGICAIMLGAGSPFPSWSEELPVKATTESDASAQRDVDGPSSAQPERDSASEQEGPRPERRLTPFRPRSLTPEEHEEAERLKRLAAKYGTDPTAIVGRVQLSGQYPDLPQGVHASDSTLRVDLPFRSNWLLRVDAPFVKWTDPNRPAIGSATGASDIFTTLGWRLYNTPEHAFVIGAVSTFPQQANKPSDRGNIRPGRSLPRLVSFPNGNRFSSAYFSTNLRRWRSVSIGHLTHSGQGADQYDLGRAVVDRRPSGVAGRLGAQCQEQHDHGIRGRKELDGTVGCVRTPRGRHMGSQRFGSL